MLRSVRNDVTGLVSFAVGYLLGGIILVSAIYFGVGRQLNGIIGINPVSIRSDRPLPVGSE